MKSEKCDPKEVYLFYEKTWYMLLYIKLIVNISSILSI